jgi:hypothetical protein
MIDKHEDIMLMLAGLEEIIDSNNPVITQVNKVQARFLYFKLNRASPMPDDINIAEDYLNRVNPYDTAS